MAIADAIMLDERVLLKIRGKSLLTDQGHLFHFMCIANKFERRKAKLALVRDGFAVHVLVSGSIGLADCFAAFIAIAVFKESICLNSRCPFKNLNCLASGLGTVRPN